MTDERRSANGERQPRHIAKDWDPPEMLPRRRVHGRFTWMIGSAWDELPEPERRALRVRYVRDFLRVKSDAELVSLLAFDPDGDFERHCVDWHNEEVDR